MARMPASLLDKFWLKMATMFGHTWVSQYGAAPDGVGGDTWATALSGITPAQLGNGLRAALASGAEWPPSAPRFRAMCLGIPDFASVRRELGAQGTKRSPFAVLVWQHLDTCRYRNANADQADRLLREAYDAAHDHVMRGGVLPEEVPELSAPVVDHGAKSWETLRDYAASMGIDLNKREAAQ